MSDILDALSYVGDALNKPGRAVRGILAGNPNELAAAIPFSDSMGLTDSSNSTSGKDLLNALGIDAGSGLGGDVAGFATEVATDPLTWMGAGLGSRVGRAAEKAAVARGPQYATTAADLENMASKYIGMPSTSISPTTLADIAQTMPGQAAAVMRKNEILKSPIASQLLQQIPEGAQMLGAGAEGAAFLGPNGNVTRIGRYIGDQPGRPIAPGLLQAISTTDLSPGVGRMWRSEVLPQARGVGNDALFAAKAPQIDQQLAQSGLQFTDRGSRNFGMIGNNPVVIDPGAVEPLTQYLGKFQNVVPAAQPSMPMNALLDLLGAQSAVRQGAPSFMPIMSLLGGGTGSAVGAAGRLAGG